MLDDTLDLSNLDFKPPTRLKGKRSSLTNLLKEIDELDDLDEIPQLNIKHKRGTSYTTKHSEGLPADNLLIENHGEKISFSSKTHLQNREPLLKLKFKPSKRAENPNLEPSSQVTGPIPAALTNKLDSNDNHMSSPTLAMMFKNNRGSDSTPRSLLKNEDAPTFSRPVYRPPGIDTVNNMTSRPSQLLEDNTGVEENTTIKKKMSLSRLGRTYKESLPKDQQEDEVQTIMKSGTLKRLETEAEKNSPSLRLSMVDDALAEYSRENRVKNSLTSKIHLPKIGGEMDVLTKLPLLENDLESRTPSHYNQFGDDYRFEGMTPSRLRHSLAATYESSMPNRYSLDSGHFKRSSMGSNTMTPMGSDHILRNILDRRSGRESVNSGDNNSPSRGDSSPSSFKTNSAGQSPLIVSNEGNSRQIKRMDNRSSIFRKVAENDLVKFNVSESPMKKR